MIRGETVILINREEIGRDPFGNPIYDEKESVVSDVIIGQPTFEEALSDMQLNGKRLAFVLGIPKNDTHEWKDSIVLIRSERFRTYGFPLEQTVANVPGKWNMQVKVERYE